jgi:diaminopimelate decarboxylase
LAAAWPSPAPPARRRRASVGAVKHSPDGATIAAVDEGMTDNMRVALYGAEDEVLAPGRPHGPPRRVTVVGKHGESGDIPPT